MTILGNIFLALATLMYALILSAAYGKTPASSGDAAGGYAMGTILFNLVLTGLLIAVAVSIAWKGGFDWIKGPRYLLVGVGLLATMIVAALSMAVKFEPAMHQPFAVRYLTGIAPGLFPLVLLAAGAVLLNEPLRAAVPPAFYQIPLAIVTGISVLACAVGVVEWMGHAQKNAVARIEEMQSDQERYRQMHLAEIEANDPMVNMARILVFTDKNHHETVREKALAKVKSNPDWQAELVRMLEGDASQEAFTFLASNAVDDKALFAEPVNKGIRSTADWIRQSIRRSSHEAHFHEGQFAWNVERMLATADTFQGLGVDYLPAVREVRAALDEPNAHKKIRFSCISTIERWIGGR